MKDAEMLKIRKKMYEEQIADRETSKKISKVLGALAVATIIILIIL
jgi:hypothetical protein